MRILAIILGVVWTISGLGFLALAAEESSTFLLIFGGIIAGFSGLSVLLMALKMDRLAIPCVVIAAAATVPIGLIFGFVGMAALRSAKDQKSESALDDAMRRAK